MRSWAAYDARRAWRRKRRGWRALPVSAVMRHIKGNAVAAAVYSKRGIGITRGVADLATCTPRPIGSRLGRVASRRVRRQGVEHLVVFGESADLVLTEHERTVCLDVEDAAGALDQLGLDVESLLDGFRQTGGLGQVVSRYTIGDADGHSSIPAWLLARVCVVVAGRLAAYAVAAVQSRRPGVYQLRAAGRYAWGATRLRVQPRRFRTDGGNK